MSMADQFDAFDDDEMAELEDELASKEFDSEPFWVDACPDDICNSQGWCRHRYKSDPR